MRARFHRQLHTDRVCEKRIAGKTEAEAEENGLAQFEVAARGGVPSIDVDESW